MINRTACVILTISCTIASAELPQKSRDDPWNAGPADPKDPETWTFAPRTTRGFVKHIDKDGITLYWPELKTIRLRHDPLTGQKLEEKEERFPAVAAKKFLLVEALAKGEYLKSAPNQTYRITDVRVGDLVMIEFQRLNGVDICRTVLIERRPGGRVPPAPNEKPDSFRKYHESVNAEQEWEEDGIAPPEKYRPIYLGPDNKFYYARYPPETIRLIPVLPIAPTPRELKPNAPPAKP